MSDMVIVEVTSRYRRCLGRRIFPRRHPLKVVPRDEHLLGETFAYPPV